MMHKTLLKRWCWPLAVLVLWYAAALGGVGGLGSATARGANIEPAIIPSVHMALTPTSAIQAPIRFSAGQAAVWRADLEQRMLLSSGVTVSVGYRLLSADNAAVWLTPSRESGEAVYDVAIYLSGNVAVREGNAANSTVTRGRELLVTTRVTQNIQLTGMPINKAEDESPLVKRGDELRNQILNRKPAPLHIPRIVITPAEEALQSGWIARGPNNRILPGPGDFATTQQAPKNPRPRPNIFATGDDYRMQQIDKEMVTVMPGAYLLYDSQDGKPPLEFRAQRMVVFSPISDNAATTTAPATAPVSGAGANKDVSQFVTGVYLEGDVTLDQGDQVMVRAERVFYDFTTQRAIMLDATLATIDTTRNVPLYLRAAEIRQTARGEYAAKSVKFSTSEFAVPHYHIGASEIYLRDVSAQLQAPTAGIQPGSGFDLGLSGNVASKEFLFDAKDITVNINGTSVFYWPFLSGDTANNDIPLKNIRISNSRTFGMTLLTDWDIFGLAGQQAPQGLKADLNLDYFGKRGPAAGVQSSWLTDEDRGLLRSYVIMDQGVDRLGRDRDDVTPQDEGRGRFLVREQHDLGDGWKLSLEGAYVSDPTFMEQFFQHEFNSDKDQETSLYLKKTTDTSVLSFLGKWNLMDFTATADRIDDQFVTDKQPEIKYWRIGDSILDLFTYYSETSVSDLHMDITDFTPKQLGLLPTFLGPPANVVPLDQTFRAYLKSQGWTDGDVLRGDTRHEIDFPLQIGDAKIVPYATGRFTFWDTGFPEDEGGSTSRVWAGGGVRSSMQFWKVYDDAQSVFFDVHRLRHVIEPQFNIFAGASNVDRKDLQPFDRDVEGINGSSGMQLALNQKWQTKRGGEGHWRNVDWITLNVAWNQFWDKEDTGTFFMQRPLRGFYFMSRPELSLATNSIDVNGTWRIGERVRFMGDANYNLDTHNIEQASAGIAIDQSNNLTYFIGNRYIHALNTDEWTFALDYQLTQKYELIAAESYDFKAGENILTSVTLLRKMPRFNVAVTVTYDANNSDTSFVFTAWPEGFPSGLSPTTGAAGGR